MFCVKTFRLFHFEHSVDFINNWNCLDKKMCFFFLKNINNNNKFKGVQLREREEKKQKISVIIAFCF